MVDTLRVFNNIGVEKFRAYLHKLHNGEKIDPPWELLDEPSSTVELSTEILIYKNSFSTRWSIGKFLNETLSSLSMEEISRNRGLWAWLSLFYFNQVCPVLKDGLRRPGQDYRHIPDFGYRYRYRHLLMGPYQVYRRHGPHSILLLSGPVHMENAIYHEITSRQDLIANRGVVEASLNLYLDRKQGAPKQGCQDAKGGPGTIRRFVRVLQQFDLTFDVYGMSGKDIVNLLPKEFQLWQQLKVE